MEEKVFSKFPELVAGEINVEMIDDIQHDMTEIYIGWGVWMPIKTSSNIVTLEKMRAKIKIQLSAEMLEDQPETLALQFNQAFVVMEQQMEKVKFEFYKKGINPRIVAPYLKKYAVGTIIQMPYISNPSGIGAIP
jgi:hypothetical protein